MSVSSASQLPRFDDLKGLSPLTSFDQETGKNPPIKVPEAIVPDEPVAAEISNVSDISDMASEPDEATRFREEAQEMLQGLMSAAEKIEESAEKQISFAIQTIATEILPQISSAFLAEELAMHVPNLINLAPPLARIQAPVRIAEQLRLAANNISDWPEGWTIDPVEGAGAPRVQMLWDQGGLTYDPDKILAACLSRLGEYINGTEEE